ncbi:MAG: response regulator [Archangium sp.]|nr:response regulator [Archangium sp.]
MDDELPVGRALERWLQRRGAVVFLLTNPVQFEEVLLRERPTLIICDYLMPGLDGVELLAVARRLAPAVRRCLLSGSLFLVSAERRALLEPCAFLDKPWDADQLGALLAPDGGATS